MKICKQCNIEKDEAEFYSCWSSRDGFGYVCKSCLSKNAKAKYHAKPKKIKTAIEKLHAQQQSCKSRMGIVNSESLIKKYCLLFPEKLLANREAQKIKVPPGTERHHWSYNIDHILDIIPLTKLDHMTIHRYIVYDQERMMFRGVSGELLDTKEIHIQYISQFITN